MILKREEFARHLGSVAEGCKSGFGLECECSCEPGTDAYVYPIWSDVHLCPPCFAKPPNDQAGTIIHELMHKDAGIGHDAGGVRGSIDPRVHDTEYMAEAAQLMCSSFEECTQPLD